MLSLDMTFQAIFCRQHDITDRANVFKVHVFGFNVSTHVTLLFGGKVAKFAIGNAISNNDISDRIHCKKRGKSFQSHISYYFFMMYYVTKTVFSEDSRLFFGLHSEIFPDACPSYVLKSCVWCSISWDNIYKDRPELNVSLQHAW